MIDQTYGQTDGESGMMWPARGRMVVNRRSGLFLAGALLLIVPACNESGTGAAEEAGPVEAASAAGEGQKAPARGAIPREAISDIRDADGSTPQRPTLDPMRIIEEDDMDQLLGFLYWQRDPDWESEDGSTLLIAAVTLGRSEMVETLIRYGADVNVGARMDMTPLHWAARRDQVDIARVLLENGANPNALGGPERDITPMAVAANRANREMIHLLAEFGGEP